MAKNSSSGNLALTVTLAKRLCPCTERTASRGTGSLAPGAVSLAIRQTVDGRYMLRVECPVCGAWVEEDWSGSLRVYFSAPPPGASLLTMSPTQQPGKA